MNIINLTPHDIVLRDSTGFDTTYPSQGVARVSSQPGQIVDYVGVIPVYGPNTLGEVQGLPDPVVGTVYIVSGLVAAHVKRADVFSPGTGPQDGAIRNDKGHIVAVTRLKASVNLPRRRS